jgi:hypothetical protein
MHQINKSIKNEDKLPLQQNPLYYRNYTYYRYQVGWILREEWFSYNKNNKEKPWALQSFHEILIQ